MSWPLSVTPGRTAVLFHCFAGCTREAIMAALREMQLNPTINAASTVAATTSPDLTALVNEIWSLARPTEGTPAGLYLEQRGIGRSRIGRFAPATLTYEAAASCACPRCCCP
jgi:putative DNA primase/helicase